MTANHSQLIGSYTKHLSLISFLNSHLSKCLLDEHLADFTSFKERVAKEMDDVERVKEDVKVMEEKRRKFKELEGEWLKKWKKGSAA